MTVCKDKSATNHKHHILQEVCVDVTLRAH